MKTIALANQKGGVGKTTTAASLGVGLCRQGKKVLLIDADAQGNLTQMMGWPQPDELSPTLADLMGGVITDKPIEPGEGILETREGVHLVPANIDLSAIEVALVNTMSRETVLRQLLARVSDRYDYAIIDCMPSLGMLTINALTAADSVIIPVQAQYLPAKGLEQLLKTVARVRRQLNPRLEIDGILLTMVDERTKLSKGIVDLIRRTYGGHVFTTQIPRSVRAAEISVEEKSIYDLDRNGRVATSCEHLTNPKYLTADEYLSGNVREKLQWAKRSAELYPDDYAPNVQALEAVQPADLTAAEISVRLGATWLPTDVAEQFIYEVFGTPPYAQWKIKVHYSQYTGDWNVENKGYDRFNVKAHSTYGTNRVNGYKIVEETLNLRAVRIFDYVEDERGNRKPVLNKKETAIAQGKQELIKQAFQDWIWADQPRRERLCRLYNGHAGEGIRLRPQGAAGRLSVREQGGRRRAARRLLGAGHRPLDDEREVNVDPAEASEDGVLIWRTLLSATR